MRVLGNWAEEFGGDCSTSNAGFTMQDKSVRSPDASLVSDARMKTLTPDEKRGFAPLCPEFLVEVLSESDSGPKLEAKLEMWIANSAQLAWMLDPFASDMTIYQPRVAPRSTVRPGMVREAEAILLGFRLQTSRLWAK